jgi:hypothetical protein
MTASSTLRLRFLLSAWVSLCTMWLSQALTKAPLVLQLSRAAAFLQVFRLLSPAAHRFQFSLLARLSPQVTRLRVLMSAAPLSLPPALLKLSLSRLLMYHRHRVPAQQFLPHRPTRRVPKYLEVPRRQTPLRPTLQHLQSVLSRRALFQAKVLLLQ